MALTVATSVPVKALSAADRSALTEHFLQLPAIDRRLRFGSPLSDEAVRAYVQGLDFQRDAIFGVFDDDLALAGVGHVAVGPDAAEFGLSVVPGARRRGIGTALFERANLFARTHMIHVLFMHCLLENRAVMHIARKSGMRIVAESGEADAHIELQPARASTFAAELMSDRVALFDHTLKTQLALARRFSAALAGPNKRRG